MDAIVSVVRAGSKIRPKKTHSARATVVFRCALRVRNIAGRFTGARLQSFKVHRSAALARASRKECMLTQAHYELGIWASQHVEISYVA